MADGLGSSPTDPRFFFLPSLPALPKVSRDRWRQEYTGCSTVLAVVLTDLVLVHANGWADAAGGGAFTRMHGALMLAVEGLAALALLLLAGVMCGGRDLVVHPNPNPDPDPDPNPNLTLTLTLTLTPTLTLTLTLTLT